MVYRIQFEGPAYSYGLQVAAGQVIEAIEAQGWRLEHFGSDVHSMLAVFRRC
jgi:hypothetical protein